MGLAILDSLWNDFIAEHFFVNDSYFVRIAIEGVLRTPAGTEHVEPVASVLIFRPAGRLVDVAERLGKILVVFNKLRKFIKADGRVLPLTRCQYNQFIPELTHSHQVMKHTGQKKRFAVTPCHVQVRRIDHVTTIGVP